VKLFFL